MDSFSEYQKEALSTAAKSESVKDQLITAALGLAGESGEVADIIKKLMFQGHDFDQEARQKLINEAGDVLWYLSLLTDALHTNLGEIAEINRNKLRRRYPNGFDPERSKNRPQE